MQESKVFTLPDGRELGWLEWGDPGGSAVFLMHGTPGTRYQLVLDKVSRAVPGMRFINPDRPGYGLSTYQPQRRLSGWPSDVAHLADHLSVQHFHVLGVSGGGPHAAACACLLQDRILGAAIVSGVGLPVRRASEDGRQSLSLRAAGAVSAIQQRLMCEVQTYVSGRWPDRAMGILARQLPPSDVATIGRPEVRAVFRQDSKRPSRTTARAMIQDLELGNSDWGLNLSSIHVPVHIWHGRGDRTIPFEQAQRLSAAIPGSVLHEIDAGHLLIVDHFEEIVAAF
jgi:pimeloyl-ACP methyl ester carboxylesterase